MGIDVLFAMSGIEPELVATASNLQALVEVLVPVATVGCLLELKTLPVDERRPQDRADIGALLKVAGRADLQETERMLALITRRGCDRGCDLPGLFTRLCEELRPRR